MYRPSQNVSYFNDTFSAWHYLQRQRRQTQMFQSFELVSKDILNLKGNLSKPSCKIKSKTKFALQFVKGTLTCNKFAHFAKFEMKISVELN